MKLVITDSGLGGLSVCAKLLQLLSEPAGANHPNYPADDLQITYINAVPSNNRGYNSMSGKAEQLKTFEIILRNTEKIFSPHHIFVACGTLSVLLDDLEIPSKNAVKIEGILQIGVKMLLSSLLNDAQSSAIIFGTPTMINAKTFQNELFKNGVEEIRIISQGCPDLATQISNDPDSSFVEERIRHWVQKAMLKLPEKYIDTLLIFLACTHYGYRQDLFQKAFNEEGFFNMTLLNPNLAAAENLVKTVSNNLNPSSTESKAFSVEFVTPYAIPEQEIITLTQLLSPISPATADALNNARICPELLNP